MPQEPRRRARPAPGLWWVRRLAWLGLLALLVLHTGRPRAALLPPVPDAQALMNWAEAAYPAYFPGPQPTLAGPGYVYRHYPATGNYVGVAGDEVYLLGPVAGHASQPQRVGRLADFICLVTPAACAAPVDKPWGTFASAPGNTIYGHPQLRGVLLRAAWSSLEPRPGEFDLSAIERQLTAVRAAGKSWSLAIGAGGPGSPAWLMDGLGAAAIPYAFRGTPMRLPLFWDTVVQQRLALLAQRLAQAWGDDPTLKLVYVTQMTANGIEGHLQGVDMAVMKQAGYTDERWVDAALQASRAFAQAFAGKALAFEVHDVNGGASVPARILEQLQQDSTLGQRVGAAVWWLSGRVDYQAALLQVLASFTGDKYGQVIARSDQASRFAEQDYRSVFTQGRQLGLRYIEPWEYDFGTGTGTANGAWDAELKAFNDWAAAQFGRQPAQAVAAPAPAR
ncbi:MAG: hypothetical protein HY855_01220 [Burkholderiales bacterium]|nr:hypothetical protein [Burkholderiales bacterium]